MFPQIDLTGLDETIESEQLPSSQKWTYVIDFEKRRLVIDDDGRPKKTRTYQEYLLEIAKKILNTERFQYAIYDEEIGVERSEWSRWSDIEIKRDIQEALQAHNEITSAEVLEIRREEKRSVIFLRITGIEGDTETEVQLYA